jgi:predicted transcriptional regulator
LRGSCMQTTVNLPDALYRQSEALAASRGATVEQLIVDAIQKEVQSNLDRRDPVDQGGHEAELPVIRSARPGSLDLSDFDFDDLVA